MTITLGSDIRYLKGVGPALVDKFQKLGVTRILDLLFHLPRDYQDRTRVTPIMRCQMGRYTQIEGAIEDTQVTFGKRRALVVTVNDGTASIHLRFFHFNQGQKANFEKGRVIRCFAEVRLLNQGLEMVHPEYQLDPEPLHTQDPTLTAIYPSTQGISQKLWRQVQAQALELMTKDASLLDVIQIPSSLPALQIHLTEALQNLHNPPPDTRVHLLHEGTHPYQQRLAFEELLAHQLCLIKFRHKRQQLPAALMPSGQLNQDLQHNLPFSLTNAQQTAVSDIDQDLNKNTPMLRLIQGDVGSGKTIVAALACCTAIENGHQAVFMAPTEILAEQHAESFAQWFTPLGINVELLLGRHTAKQKRERLARLVAGEVQLLIGTHAVIEDSVIFKQLGLVIIDEQHRFGVHQRLALRHKGGARQVPHQLIMTATPIPRTLAMTAYADLDLSIIDELPPGRQPIQTRLVDQVRREEITSRIRAVCAEGRQAYWVCTLIETSETLNCQAAEDTLVLLQSLLPDLTVGLIHGKLKPADKAMIMDEFVTGNIDLLVATTVIEVGVNVPNASIMVIENPERLGLSQLHQLRGRVGRGSHQSYCLFLYQSPLSHHAKQRLQVMRETNDGFKIAEKDLELRGPGDILGNNQTGLIRFRIADISRDAALLDDVQSFAKHLVKDKDTTEQLINRWLINPDYFIDG